MTCQCHDPGVFGHQQPCPAAAPVPSKVYDDKQTGQFLIVPMQSRQRL